MIGKRPLLTNQTQNPRASLIGWVVDVTLGSVAGFIVGAILAVNIVIFSGVDDGYQASVRQVFSQKPLAGVLAGLVLILLPLVAVIGLRRVRRSRT